MMVGSRRGICMKGENIFREEARVKENEKGRRKAKGKAVSAVRIRYKQRVWQPQTLVKLTRQS